MQTNGRRKLDAKLPEVRVYQEVYAALAAEAKSRPTYTSLGAVITEALNEYIQSRTLFKKHNVQIGQTVGRRAE